MCKELWDRQGKTLRVTRRKCFAESCFEVKKKKDFGEIEINPFSLLFITIGFGQC